jgi:hypothetical protein
MKQTKPKTYWRVSIAGFFSSQFELQKPAMLQPPMSFLFLCVEGVREILN